MSDHEITAEQYRELMAKQGSGNKYSAVRTEVDGIVFDSRAEARRYAELKLMERAGEIVDLELQPVFPLIVCGEKIADYVADFRYVNTATGATTTEDVKSPVTRRNRAYRLKIKLVKALHNIEIVEVMG